MKTTRRSLFGLVLGFLVAPLAKGAGWTNIERHCSPPKAKGEAEIMEAVLGFEIKKHHSPFGTLNYIVHDQTLWKRHHSELLRAEIERAMLGLK